MFSKKKGVTGVKYNYSNNEHQNITLWFENNFRDLCWRKDQNIRWSSLKVSQIKGIIYGSFTSTFDRHQQYVNGYYRFKNALPHGSKRDPTKRRQGIVPNQLHIQPGSMSDHGVYYVWECVSLIMEDRTYDFVIKEPKCLFAFLNILINYIHHYNRPNKKELKEPLFAKAILKYKVMNMRMKIRFMAWQQKIHICELFLRSIFKVLKLK